MNVFLLKELEDQRLITLGRGYVISKNEMLAIPGDYPVYSSSATGDGEFGRYGKYMFDDERITWSIDGGGKPFHRKILNTQSTNVGGWIKVNNPNLLETKYLYYSLLWQWVNLVFDYTFKAHPSVIRNLYKIKLVPIKEQKYIVATLDKINELIDANKRQLELLDEAVKARFGEMFGDSFNSFGWPLHELESVVQINKCKSIPTLDSNERAWLLNLDMVESDTGKIIDFNMVDIDAIGSSTVKFDDSSILYSKLRPYLNKVVIPSKSGYATSEILVMNPSKKINRFFLATLLRSKNFVDFANSTSYGAKMPRASVSMIKQYKLMCPPIDIQDKFEVLYLKSQKLKSYISDNIILLQELLNKKMDEFFCGDSNA